MPDYEGPISAYLSGLRWDSGHASITLKKVLDKGLVPDKVHALPGQFDWMEEKIRGLNLRGTGLEDSNLLSSLACRPCLLIHRMDVTFRFSLFGTEGH
ncbi:hypothetical protein PPUN110474_27450 [Pseudomonas putida]|nr:hypothetical protein PPUN110474_27450 [Pseudomonas putida]